MANALYNPGVSSHFEGAAHDRYTAAESVPARTIAPVRTALESLDANVAQLHHHLDDLEDALSFALIPRMAEPAPPPPRGPVNMQPACSGLTNELQALRDRVEVACLRVTSLRQRLDLW